MSRQRPEEKDKKTDFQTINIEKEEKNSISERTILSCERVADVSFDGLHVVDGEVQSNELVLYNQRNSMNVLHRMSEVLICFA